MQKFLDKNKKELKEAKVDFIKAVFTALLEFVGYVAVVLYVNWQLAVAIFLICWANNRIERK